MRGSGVMIEVIGQETRGCTRMLGGACMRAGQKYALYHALHACMACSPTPSHILKPTAAVDGFGPTKRPHTVLLDRLSNRLCPPVSPPPGKNNLLLWSLETTLQHTHLLPSLNKLHRNQLPGTPVAHQFSHSKIAGANVLDLRCGAGRGFGSSGAPESGPSDLGGPGHGPGRWMHAPTSHPPAHICCW